MKHIKIRFEENANLGNFNISFNGSFLFEDNGAVYFSDNGVYIMLTGKLEDFKLEEKTEAEAKTESNTVSETTFLKALAIMKGHVKNIDL